MAAAIANREALPHTVLIMIRCPLPPLAFVCLVTGWSAWAHAQQAPLVDANTVLSTIKDLKAKRTGIVTKEKSNILAALNAAAADPAKAYEQAVMVVELQGGSNDGARVVEWRKRHADLLRNRDFLIGLRLHLAYLNLTWQHGTGTKTKDLLPALMDYTAQITANAAALGKFDVLTRPLGQSVFVQYFQMAPYLGKSNDWHDQPLDVEGIYQKTLLPELRAQKDPRVLEYWTTKIALETARASASNNNLTVARFNNVRRPSLLWNRAEDELLIGQQNQAVADMLAQLKAHPDHPDFDRWSARLTEIVTPPPPPPGEVTVGPATEASPTP